MVTKLHANIEIFYEKTIETDIETVIDAVKFSPFNETDKETASNKEAVKEAEVFSFQSHRRSQRNSHSKNCASGFLLSKAGVTASNTGKDKETASNKEAVKEAGSNKEA